MAKIKNLSSAPRGIFIIGEDGTTQRHMLQPNEEFDGKVAETALLKTKVKAGVFSMEGDAEKPPAPQPAPATPPKTPPVGGAPTGKA